MLRDVEHIEQRYPQVMAVYRQKLEEKVQELLGIPRWRRGVLPQRWYSTPIRFCTDRETVRLKSHIESMKAALEEGGGIGRKLDFIAQEMNREANTILSKANDLETSNIAINLKTEIEKVREQIQNIE